MFRKELTQVRKGEQARDEMVMDVNGQILRDGVEGERRWAEYFKQVLNVADDREANINVVSVLGDLNERAILLDELREAVNEMKSGKVRGLDGLPMDCFKKGGKAVLEWLVRLLNVSFDIGVVPMDWLGACKVPCTKGRVTSVNVATQEVLVCKCSV